MKRRPHSQRSRGVPPFIAARGREKIRFVRIIVIAGTQPDHGRLTALLYIVSRAQKKLNRFLKAGKPKTAYADRRVTVERFSPFKGRT